MKKVFSITLILLFASSVALKAQKKTMADMFYKKINDAIYYTYDDSPYSERPVNTYTFFKIDIDKNGKVTGTGFSDSADSVFVNAYYERQKRYNTLHYTQMFVTAKGYKGVSLLMPVTFEATKPLDPAFKEPERLLRFNKKDFTGTAVMFPVINIAIMPGNKF